MAIDHIKNLNKDSLNFSIENVRKQFPILNEKVNNHPLVYFDNAATTQKPQAVIDSLVSYYRSSNANIHRGIHSLAEKATAEYEETRDAIRTFINASEREEIIFTRGTTEGINLIAQTYGDVTVQKGDEVIISAMEHHSNIVPWQILCDKKGATLKIIPIDQHGEIIFDKYKKLLTDKTKIVSIVYASNSLGTINPVKEIIEEAHRVGAAVLIDGAQSTSHLEIDVQDLDCDFYAFSGHKMYGPTGVGVLYGKREVLEAIPPYQGGGEMIKDVSFEKTSYADLPYKFEAGTPNIADVVALKSALDFISEIGKDQIMAYELSILEYATKELEKIDGLQIIGKAKKKVSVASFVIESIHHQDLAIMLDQLGVAVRTGHHCTQPLMSFYKILGTTRASFAVYNTTEEVDIFINALKGTVKMLR